MSKERLLAFSDGVMAIIITIMVLELRPPDGDTFTALKPLLPKILSYILSFVYVGIYWNNHHHLFQIVKHVNGDVLWKNLHLLFWLSLIPFVTAWMGENHFSRDAVILYGAILLMNSIAYYFLMNSLLKLHGEDSLLAVSVGKDVKGKISTVIYVLGIALSFVNAWFGIALYTLVALIWFIPDKRIENKQILKDGE
ncbi:MAG: TMEM175 family protein [Ginsengibacter sp.]